MACGSGVLGRGCDTFAREYGLSQCPVGEQLFYWPVYSLLATRTHHGRSLWWRPVAATAVTILGFIAGYCGGRRLLGPVSICFRLESLKKETVRCGERLFERYGAATIFFAAFCCSDEDRQRARWPEIVRGALGVDFSSLTSSEQPFGWLCDCQLRLYVWKTLGTCGEETSGSVFDLVAALCNGRSLLWWRNRT